jgi:diaminopimelate epimerase
MTFYPNIVPRVISCLFVCRHAEERIPRGVLGSRFTVLGSDHGAGTANPEQRTGNWEPGNLAGRGFSAARQMKLVKAHALGNDFLLADSRSLPAVADAVQLARDLCERHRGIGADGLIIFDAGQNATSMRLLNADGSHSEVSGNGVRCLAAWVAFQAGLPEHERVDIATDAGVKRLELLERKGQRYTFRAAMGAPEAIDRVRLDVYGRSVDAITLRVGNPQCVILGEVTEERLHTVASALAVHPHFPQGTNVELAAVEAPGRVRILIWERGVGPTEASGTGACAAAVAAHRFGGASNDVDVVSPGGTQRVEWRDDGLHLTGWAELIGTAEWGGF